MRNILLLLLFIPMIASSQNTTDETVLPIDSTTKLVTYQEVVQAPGIKKDDLYIRAKEWFARTFVAANSVIQLDDKESGKIIGKGISKSHYKYQTIQNPYSLHYTITIAVKEGKFRYEISNFSTEITITYPTYLTNKQPIEQYINNDYSSLSNLSVSKKFKEKAIAAQKDTAKQIMESTNDTAKSIADSIRQSLLSSNPKDNF